MDWAVWDGTHGQVARESSYMGREWQCDFYFGYGFDVIEENALNEKSCIQVLRILITKANNEILELEEDLVTLQSQLAWTDESWSEICSASLREKINCLDISIQSLKNTNVQDEHDFGGCLLLHREPAERMHEIVKAMLEKYFHQKDEQIAPFDPTKKKKKKEEVVIQDPANDAVDNLSEKTESLSVSDGLESTFSGLKKKKKKSIILERMKEKESSCNHSFHGKGMTEIINMKSMHRQPEHVMTFLLAEMGTSGLLDGQQRLVVKGRFAPKNFEGILWRYMSMSFAMVAKVLTQFSQRRIISSFLDVRRLVMIRGVRLVCCCCWCAAGEFCWAAAAAVMLL